MNGKAGDPAITAPFDAVLCDKVFRLSVVFPGLIRIKPTYDASSLTLDFGSETDPLDNPLYFKLIDNLPDCGSHIVIGLQQVIRRLTVSDKAITLETVDRTHTDCRFIMTLNLVPVPKAEPLRSALSRIGSAVKSFAVALILSAMLLVLAGCCPPLCATNGNDNGGPKCPKATHEDCCGLDIDGYVNLGGDSYSNACHQGPYNNSCAYENVTNKEKGCVLRPCTLIGTKPNRVPTEYGWVKVGYETDLYRCGGDMYKDNVMIIRRDKVIGKRVK